MAWTVSKFNAYLFQVPAQRNSQILSHRLHRSSCCQLQALALAFPFPALLYLILLSGSLPCSLLTSSWDTTKKESTLILPRDILWRKQGAPYRNNFIFLPDSMNKTVGFSKKKKKAPPDFTNMWSFLNHSSLFLDF